ncbi:DNA adenine methylase [Campylobacter sp. VBCF_05 NA6]|uniref:DNA adenine methylase n=1 Tax=unclassified Campylobacter TaxID=2593542 RepID=UPI0022E9A784|nr:MULTISPECIES: DNA adenine methylase [unclassified Campylobacter]MDA3057642.1 DNA adenine methylase [Campylobacter sp. VBCF_04 NA7]MDA3058543.1 DNA adenine methylase [Campylobacter sp. VBCF_05 NA6]
MFELKNRRYTGAKTKLLPQIEKCVNLALKDLNFGGNLSFFDAFGGTGVVGEYFIKKDCFTKLIINDFLYSNFVIYRAFFSRYDINKLENKVKILNEIPIYENYYSDNFGNKFFSYDDAKKIGTIRENLTNLLQKKEISKTEFFILLSSLIYSIDKIANTVGHYDAYRKNIKLENKFKFELIKPLNLGKKIEIYNLDTNILVRNLVKNSEKIDISFIDPPYNSRQYSRFYHLLDNLALDEKPELFGIAKKPKSHNSSLYCNKEAKKIFEDLIFNLAKISKIIIVTYNNTNSANPRSNNRIKFDEIVQILDNIGDIQIHSFDFKPFSSGKTDLNRAFKDHKENIFICKVGK